MATDTTEAWGSDFEKIWGEGDNRYFRKFWRNVVRWLTENVDGGNRRLRVETDKVIYRPGESIQITAKAYDQTLVGDRPLPTSPFGCVGRAEVGSQPCRRIRREPRPPAQRTEAIAGRCQSHRRARSSIDPGSTTHKARARRRRVRRRQRGRQDQPRSAGHRRSGRVPRPTARHRAAHRAGDMRPAAR